MSLKCHSLAQELLPLYWRFSKTPLGTRTYLLLVVPTLRSSVSSWHTRNTNRTAKDRVEKIWETGPPSANLMTRTMKNGGRERERKCKRRSWFEAFREESQLLDKAAGPPFGLVLFFVSNSSALARSSCRFSVSCHFARFPKQDFGCPGRTDRPMDGRERGSLQVGWEVREQGIDGFVRAHGFGMKLGDHLTLKKCSVWNPSNERAGDERQSVALNFETWPQRLKVNKGI